MAENTELPSNPGDRTIQFLTTRRSPDVGPAIPTHMHAPSIDFDHQHTRNDSAALRSPFDTPNISLATQEELAAFPDNPQVAQSVVLPRLEHTLGDKPPMASTPGLVLTPHLAEGGPGPIVSSAAYSTGLTPLLQNSPLFPANAFQSQPATVKQEQQEFAAPEVLSSTSSNIALQPPGSTEEQPYRRDSLPDIDDMRFDFTESKIVPKTEPGIDSKRSSTYDDDVTLGRPPLKRRSTIASTEPLMSPLEEPPQQNETMFDVPGSDYDDPSTYSMQWTEEDDNELRKLLEEAEKVKWNYMSDQLFEAIGKRIPPSACHRKFCDLFGVPENTTLLGSSLNYIAYRDGWNVIKKFNINEQKFCC